MCKCVVIKLPESGQCCEPKDGGSERECCITVKVQCHPADEGCCAEDKPADK